MSQEQAMNPVAAEEINKDLEERINGLNAELEPLLAKYELALIGDPFIMPNGTIGARATVVSTRKLPQAASLTQPE